MYLYLIIHIFSSFVNKLTKWEMSGNGKCQGMVHNILNYFNFSLTNALTLQKFSFNQLALGFLI